MPAEETVSAGSPRVAMIYEVPPPKDYLQNALEEARIPVAAEYRAGELDRLEKEGADVVLVSLDEAMEPYLDSVTEFVAGTSMSVVFEESEVSRHLEGWDRNRWLRHLRAKLLGTSDTRPPLPRQAANDRRERPVSPDPDFPVWVLGASIGGPESVRRFLEALPVDVPAAFILVQHMGAEFQRVLADRLSRVTELEVTCAEEGRELRPGMVVVAPVEKGLDFDDQGRITCAALGTMPDPAPSIDDALRAVVSRFGARAGAIIFSGQARDGVEGCAEVARRGGRVWTQDAGSASIRAIGDGIREAGLSDFDGSPERLARQLLETGRRHRTSTNQEQG